MHSTTEAQLCKGPLATHNKNTQKAQAGTLRVRAAGDADRFVIHLQTDGTRELTLDAFARRCQRAWAAAGLLRLRLLLLLLAELCTRRDKAPKHRHHGAEDDLPIVD